jgi:2-dehydropantoate 2-reductase
VTSLAILGPGGVGGFLAAALARAGEDVVVIAQEPTAALIARDGIAVESRRLGTFTAHPLAATRLEEPVDALLVSTKATGLAPALLRIETVPELVVPLLNGLDHMALLRRRFGAGRVAAGVIRIESTRADPGRIVQTSPSFRVDLASDTPELIPRLVALAAALERAAVPVEIGPSERQIMWSKLLRLNALACTTSAADRPLGAIRADLEWELALTECVLEAAAVAEAEGAALDPGATLAELASADPELCSSMQRDIAAGRVPELDAIQGSVLRAAARHRLKCPTIARLTGQIAERAGIPAPQID